MTAIINVEMDMGRSISSLSALTAILLILLGSSVVNASPGTITGTQDTSGVWLFSAGTDTEPGGQPTDEIVENAIAHGILELLGNEGSQVDAFAAGSGEPYEGARDDTLALVVEGLSAVDDFGLIEEAEDDLSDFDAGIGGWVTLSKFGEIYPDGVPATGVIGPEEGVDPEEALGGFEIFIFEDAELSGFTCILTPSIGDPVSFTVTDRQVNPSTPNGADDTLIAIDLDSIGLSEGAAIISITISDDGVSMEEPVFGDTTLEIDAIATRVSVLVGSISGYKWNDLDGDKVWDAGELGLGGWTITLSGETSGSTTTAEDGYYLFTDLPAGSYTVSETLKHDWIRTYPQMETHNIILSPGESSAGNNFGNQYLTRESVGGEGELVTVASTNLLTLLLGVSLIGALSYAVIKKWSRILPFFQ